jgi:hypothetical protein
MASAFKEVWKNGFMNYASDMAKIYVANKEGMISCLKFDSVVNALNETYQLLTKDGEIPRVEDLPQDKKMELWNKAKTVDSDKKKCILISKAIHLLEKITE